MQIYQVKKAFNTEFVSKSGQALVVFALLLCPPLVAAQQFEGPRLLDQSVEQNSSTIIESENEGWVLLNYMVDRDGNAFEPTIVAAVGHESLTSEAISLLSNSKFAPANRSGTIVEGSNFTKYVFQTAGSQSMVSESFQEKLSALRTELQSDRKEAAEMLIQSMASSDTFNKYEAALLDIGRYQFADKYGDSEQKLAHLQSALGFELFDDNHTFLPATAAEQARRQLIALQIENKRYAEAVRTYQKIVANGDDVAADRYSSLYDELNEVAENSSIYSLQGETDDNGRWSIVLHKRAFHLDAINGEVQELKVRCEGRYVYLAYEKNTRTHLPDNWGACRLEVLGAANVGFELDQF